MNRRVFLRDGAMAMIAMGFSPAFLARTAALAGAGKRKILVAVFQRGAVDGLNMVVPYGEREYYTARPSIAITRPGGDAEECAIDLDGFFGLHPRMRGLHALWRNRSFAVVHACGSHDATRSHFDAQDYMESGTPGIKSTQDGWLNRALRALPRDETSPVRAVAVTTQLPRTLQGAAPAVAISQLERFGIRSRAGGAAVESSFEAEYAAAADPALRQTGNEAFKAVRLLTPAMRERYIPLNGAAYPRSAFGQAMQQVAQLIRADVGLEVAFVESANWDHHINEGAARGAIANRLGDLADGLAALTTDLGSAMADVVVLTMSEFGRAVAENGSRGTDHGHGNAMLLVGGGVRGGKVYGRWPGLHPDQRFEGRDLAVTTDFRDVFAEVVGRHLGLADVAPVFPGYVWSPQRAVGLL